jgi:enoyl-CoA hydratase/carnithine racemase
VSDILVERDGPIATVVLNRPKLRNAISFAMWTEIARVSRALGEDDTVRAVVYRGAGRQAFASGADISEFQQHRRDTETALHYGAQTEAAYVAIRDCPKPTVALAIGLIQRLLPPDELEHYTSAYLRTVADNAPLSVRGAKSIVQLYLEGLDEPRRERLRALALEAFESQDYKEGTRAFLEKRPPRFQGR